jgi:hypothetical protein
MDTEKSGGIKFSTFKAAFEDEIKANEDKSLMGTIDLDEIMKSKLNEMLSHARLQRSQIIQAFMVAEHKIESDGMGFGKVYTCVCVCVCVCVCGVCVCVCVCV